MKSAVSNGPLLGWLIEKMSKATEPSRRELQESLPPVERGTPVVGTVPPELRPLLWIRHTLTTTVNMTERTHQLKGLAFAETLQNIETADPKAVGDAVEQSLIAHRTLQKVINPLSEEIELIDRIFWFELRKALGVLDKADFMIADGYQVIRRRAERFKGHGIDDLSALLGRSGH